MQTILRTVREDGLEIATEAFGDRADPPVLLIMGGMASMLWWPEELCRRLAARGRFVIRYDQRDTGLSSRFPPGEPGYGFEDAVDDVFRLLDGYGLPAAHVVGFSMGGMIGQAAALTRPERVLSLTTISSTPIGVDRSGLPKSGEAWLQHMAMEPDWSDRTATVEYEIEDARLIAGAAYPFDEAATKAFLERDFDRSRGYLNATNHIVLLRGGEAWRGRLQDLRVPLLVIHGAADPVFPVEHGVALCKAVAGARLVRLGGGGHELHPGHWDQVVDAIAAHTEAGPATARRARERRSREHRMREILFIQGAGPDVHDAWDNKLVDSLRQALGDGYEVRYPRMPDEDEPDYAKWAAAIRQHIADLSDGAVLVGHSIGASIMMGALAEQPPRRRLGAIVLVSAPFVGEGGWPGDDFELPLDLGARLPPGVPVRLFQGLADDTTPATHADLYARAIPQAQTHRLPGRDHQLDDDLGEVAEVVRALDAEGA